MLKGTRYTYRIDILDTFPEWCRIPVKSFMVFRRTRATGLYRNGVELEMISVILGHSSTETTRIYATPSIEMLGEAMNTANSTIPDETPEWGENEDELARICGLR